MKSKFKPIRKKEEIRQNPGRKKNRDFNEYMGGPDEGEMLNPKSRLDKGMADTNDKEAEKRIYKNNETDEQDSDGSANAFEDK